MGQSFSSRRLSVHALTSHDVGHGRQLLNEHSEHEVHLYDSADYPGGHAHTVRFELPGQEERAKRGVDAGGKPVPGPLVDTYVPSPL